MRLYDCMICYESFDFEVFNKSNASLYIFIEPEHVRLTFIKQLCMK